MGRVLFFVVLLFGVLLSSFGSAHEHARADAHAPIGVMGDHTHKQGEWMTSYRYMRMDMDDLHDGSSEVGHADVVRAGGEYGYMMAPTQMTMSMHMVGVMYGVTDTWTMMVMAPYIENSMVVRNRIGRDIKTQSEGLGDVKLSGIFKLLEREDHQLYFNAGLSLPTGSIKERDRTLMGPDNKLAYPMQLGSGTYDALPGVTYRGRMDDWSFGAQVASTLRLGGKNSQGYQLGDVYRVDAWTGYAVSDALVPLVRVQGVFKEKTEGRDDDLNPAMMPTANGLASGGDRVDAFVGVNYIFHSGWFEGHRLALEYGWAVYENLNGPQLGVDYQLIAGWQYAF